MFKIYLDRIYNHSKEKKSSRKVMYREEKKEIFMSTEWEIPTFTFLVGKRRRFEKRPNVTLVTSKHL